MVQQRAPCATKKLPSKPVDIDYEGVESSLALCAVLFAIVLGVLHFCLLGARMTGQLDDQQLKQNTGGKRSSMEAFEKTDVSLSLSPPVPLSLYLSLSL